MQQAQSDNIGVSKWDLGSPCLVVLALLHLVETGIESLCAWAHAEHGAIFYSRGFIRALCNTVWSVTLLYDAILH